jgi:hypothetical protein
MQRRAAETGYALRFRDGKKTSRLELAIDQEILDPLIGELELVDVVAPGSGIALPGVDNFESASPTRHWVSFRFPQAASAARPVRRDNKYM